MCVEFACSPCVSHIHIVSRYGCCVSAMRIPCLAPVASGIGSVPPGTLHRTNGYKSRWMDNSAYQGTTFIRDSRRAGKKVWMSVCLLWAQPRCCSCSGLWSAGFTNFCKEWWGSGVYRTDEHPGKHFCWPTSAQASLHGIFTHKHNHKNKHTP